MNSLRNKVVGFLLLLVGVLGGGYGVNQFGSSPVGESYNATTTGAGLVANATLKTGFGQLGSAVVTKTDTGTLSFYNATTSNINLRAAKFATSTILLATFPTGATVGTYQFDLQFSEGLLVVSTGNPASTTITWK
jgi:hypothetical protein